MVNLHILTVGLLVLRAGCEDAGYGMIRYLECYRCAAYEFEDNFRSKLSMCESGNVDETVQCPYEIVRFEGGKLKNFTLLPSCTVVKQKAAGMITSYTRGCKFFTNCTEMDHCEETEHETGVCMSCCNSDLCNAAHPSLTVNNRLYGLVVVVFVAILVAT